MKNSCPYLYSLMVLTVLLLFSGCRTAKEEGFDQEYLNEWEAWNADREEWIKERYLKIFMMEEVGEGSSTVGSDSSTAIVVGRADFPAEFGRIENFGDSVLFDPAEGLGLEPATLWSKEGRDTVFYGDYSLFVFKEFQDFYVRVRDKKNAASKDHVPPEMFVPSEEFIFDAVWVADTMTMETPMSLFGSKDDEYVGYLEFEYQHEVYRLKARGKQLEFGDATNGETTYGGGRYLPFDIDEENRVVLDFNMSYSPPCAYSEFTICPLPPPENHLPFAINAGQKYE